MARCNTCTICKPRAGGKVRIDGEAGGRARSSRAGEQMVMPGGSRPGGRRCASARVQAGGRRVATTAGASASDHAVPSIFWRQ